MGISPAFDIEVSELKAGSLCLNTKKILYLLRKEPVPVVHELMPAQGSVMQKELGMVATFIHMSATFFEQQGSGGHDTRFQHRVPFTISYRNIDNRPFKQPYVLIIDLSTSRRWTEATGSLIQQ